MALTILGALPIPKLRQALSGFIVRVSGILGDSYVMLESEMQRAAIVSKGRRDLQWPAERCDKVVLVGHSQGAAVAHRLLRDPSPPNVPLLITFGSGLAKLEELDVMTARHPDQLRFAHLGVPFTVLAAIAATRILLVYTGDSWSLLALAWVLLPVGLLVAAVRMAAGDSARLRDHLSGLSLRPVRPGLEWIDLYTTDDPVPNGPLSRQGAPVRGLLSRRVVNRGSVVSDHTSYWANQVGFIPKLVARIERHAGLGLFAGAARLQALRHLVRCAKRHDLYVRWLIACRWAGIAAMGLAVIALWPHLEGLGRATLSILSEAPLDVAGKLIRGSGHVITRLLATVTGASPEALRAAGFRTLGGALPVVLIVAWTKIFRLAWEWWQGRLARQMFEPTAYPYHPADRAFIGALVVGSGMLPLVLVLLMLTMPNLLLLPTFEGRLYQLFGGTFVLSLWFLVVAAFMRGIARRHELPLTEWLIPAVVGVGLALYMTPLAVLQAPQRFIQGLIVVAVLLGVCARTSARLAGKATELLGRRAAWLVGGVLWLPTFLVVLVSAVRGQALLEAAMTGVGFYMLAALVGHGVLAAVAHFKGSRT